MEQTRNTIVYTGTHDNETLMGWYLGLSRWQRKQLKRKFAATELNIKDKILKQVLKYAGDYVILPVQDIIGLDNHARINFPGKIGSPNWEWKLASFDNLLPMVNWLGSEIKKSGR
jgi:4-alpha-glucanotransferase